jgi:hypothetical protein
MLWAQPPPQALKAVTDAERRLVYAGFVSHIAHNNFGAELMQWAPLLRPRVLKVPRHIQRLKGTAYPLMLRPNIRRLQCPIAAFARPTMLKNLARLCPHLVDLVLRSGSRGPTTHDGVPQLLDAEVLASVLQKQVRLARIVFEPNQRFAQHGFPSTVFEDLAARGELRLLKTTGRVSTACVARVFRSDAQPFRSLHCLRIRVHSDAVGLLAEALPRLTYLTLELCDGRHSPFPLLAPWTRLRTFCLHMPDGSQLSPEDFARIEKLGGQLLTLGLDTLSGGDKRLQAPGFADSNLLRLVAAFPRLRMLNFNVASRLSAMALRLLGDQCPNLERLVLSSCIDLRTLDSARVPLFPYLEDFMLGGVLQHDAHATP